LNLGEVMGAPLPSSPLIAPGGADRNAPRAAPAPVGAVDHAAPEALRAGLIPAPGQAVVGSAPIRVILEPSYMPLAPVRPAPIEAVLPAGLICWRPPGGAVQQARLAPAEAQYLYDQALAALKLPRTAPPLYRLEVIPTIFIICYAGFAYRWWLLETGPPPLQALHGVLTERAGYSTNFGGAVKGVRGFQNLSEPKPCKCCLL